MPTYSPTRTQLSPDFTGDTQCDVVTLPRRSGRIENAAILFNGEACSHPMNFVFAPHKNALTAWWLETHIHHKRPMIRT
jgi:hypothetical protein